MPKKTEAITISAPNIQLVNVPIVGIAPLVVHRFSAKAQAEMRATQEAGSTAKKGKKREPRDFEADYKAAMYQLADGGYGMAASAFRNACISACRVAGFQMTKAKLSVFVEPDGFDTFDQTPLVRIKGEPEPWMTYARNDNGGTDLRMRPMWAQWSIDLVIRFDGDQFTTSDVINLLSRAGMQVGVGEGRPDSKKSAGLGFGLFRIREG